MLIRLISIAKVYRVPCFPIYSGRLPAADSCAAVGSEVFVVLNIIIINFPLINIA